MKAAMAVSGVIACVGCQSPNIQADEHHLSHSRRDKWYENVQLCLSRYKESLARLGIDPVPGIEKSIDPRTIPVHVTKDRLFNKEVVEVGGDIVVRFDTKSKELLYVMRLPLMTALMTRVHLRELKHPQRPMSVVKASDEVVARLKDLGLKIDQFRLDKAASDFDETYGCWHICWSQTWNGIEFLTNGIYVDYHDKFGILTLQIHEAQNFIPPKGEMIRQEEAVKRARKYARRFINDRQEIFKGYLVDMNCNLRKLILAKNSMDAPDPTQAIQVVPSYTEEKRIAWVAVFEVKPIEQIIERAVLVIYVDAETGGWIGGASPFQ